MSRFHPSAVSRRGEGGLEGEDFGALGVSDCPIATFLSFFSAFLNIDSTLEGVLKSGFVDFLKIFGCFSI
jgi:hypothetical protein